MMEIISIAVLITKAYTFVKTVYLEKVIHLILCKLHLNKVDLFFKESSLPQHNKIGTLKIK